MIELYDIRLDGCTVFFRVRNKLRGDDLFCGDTMPWVNAAKTVKIWSINRPVLIKNEKMYELYVCGASVVHDNVCLQCSTDDWCKIVTAVAEFNEYFKMASIRKDPKPTHIIIDGVKYKLTKEN